MTARLADRLFLAGFILAGAYYLFQSFELATAFAGSGFGPGHFPIILGVLLIVLCLAQLAIPYFQPDAEAEPDLELPNAGKLALTIGLTAIFYVAWAATGQFYIPAAVFFFALVVGYAPVRNRRSVTIAAVVATLFTAALYLIFDIALGVSLA